MDRETGPLWALPDTLLHLNRQGILLDFQTAARQPLDLPTSALGKSISEFFPTAFVDQFHRYCALALESGAVQTWEYDLQVDRQIYQQEARLALLGNDQAVVIIRDITERKGSTEVLHFTEQYYKHLIHNLQV